MSRQLKTQVFKDLLSRFVINTNYNEKNWELDLIENVQKAEWFYKDFYQKKHPSLPDLTLGKLCYELLSIYKPLKQQDSRRLITNYKKYRNDQPKCGSILLTRDLDKVLLVLGVPHGKNKKGKWGFPKGTLELDESTKDCVIRETREEIGYDLAGKLNEKNCLKKKLKSTLSYMYIVTDVDPNQKFNTETRNEIQDIKWFPVDKIPSKDSNYVLNKYRQELLNWIKFKKSERNNGGGIKIDLKTLFSNSKEKIN
ncbi:m7gpppn-mRNA hydrolase [Anaeramoeba flamelloides]|uniref:M7gpppn-mRNA hydrolase n=1 Tax=Anaeramoeba flamelloides TaxID=1746091 RepID=A0AAV7YMG9_9EUKA|nr:m7gpppn-mRNA hydrolase [Anaeramoeba flamelloides]KAJ6234849.1 m7gpppn-mRNA hydrolase [Anaeramoeba flamelloides]|eukprot:Anaeramoba_flamelloidesa815392_259.p1 GENE.a815392_259~~a815392_259.p1  ORF type:complete len:254 (-),score=72.59 a815392_259:193-954(-)